MCYQKDNPMKDDEYKPFTPLEKWYIASLFVYVIGAFTSSILAFLVKKDKK